MYTSVKGLDGAVSAAAALVADDAGPAGVAGPDALAATLPLLVDQVQAEAGVWEPRIAARALLQARGELARAVSLVRAWAAGLPRLATIRVAFDELRTVRRITPAFVEPEGGQFLGASLDYAPRLLDLSDEPDAESAARPASGGAHTPELAFPRSLAPLEREDLVREPHPVAEPEDITRTPADEGGRGAFLQALARGETGALTAIAYTAQRGYAQRQDPTIAELRQGTLPLRIAHPRTGATVEIGELPASLVEIVFYRIHDGEPDARFTPGVGATIGRVERRAIASAILDASCARQAGDASPPTNPSDDREFLLIALDGQESAGFVEHLKLPHHVSFTSDLDRLREAGKSQRGER
jgi:alpha-D-ribose 1-methylphosphonate 5-triphosphate synthase subunit PhnI